MPRGIEGWQRRFRAAPPGKSRFSTLNTRRTEFAFVLPVFHERQTNDSSVIRLCDAESRGIAGTRIGSILKSSMLSHQVLNGELDGDSLQVVVQRHVACVVTERQIDRIPCRLCVGKVADRAGQ